MNAVTYILAEFDSITLDPLERHGDFVPGIGRLSARFGLAPA
jgi:hypothetical protein